MRYVLITELLALRLFPLPFAKLQRREGEKEAAEGSRGQLAGRQGIEGEITPARGTRGSSECLEFYRLRDGNCGQELAGGVRFHLRFRINPNKSSSFDRGEADRGNNSVPAFDEIIEPYNESIVNRIIEKRPL